MGQLHSQKFSRSSVRSAQCPAVQSTISDIYIISNTSPKKVYSRILSLSALPYGSHFFLRLLVPGETGIRSADVWEKTPIAENPKSWSLGESLPIFFMVLSSITLGISILMIIYVLILYLKQPYILISYNMMTHMRTMVLECLPTFARTKSPSFVRKYTIHGAYGINITLEYFG